MSDVNDTIQERDSRYGDYFTQAKITMDLIERMMVTPNWLKLDAGKKLALINIAIKQGRILNGDPEYADNWHDIGGYAKLAEDSCKPVQERGALRDCCDSVQGGKHENDCTIKLATSTPIEPPIYSVGLEPPSTDDVSIVLIDMIGTTHNNIRVPKLYKQVEYKDVIYTRSWHCNNRYYETLRTCCFTGFDEPHGIMGGAECKFETR